jgi:hypothetical protein
MASFNYARIAATSIRLLAKFGAPVTLRDKALGTYDPATGAVTAAAPADKVRNGALLDFGAGQVLAPGGGLIQAGDKRLLLEPGSVPGLEDNVIAGGIEYVIKGIGEVNPAGTPVMYDLHLRKG